MSAQEASNQFYAALNMLLGGDSSGMADIWAQGVQVTTMHPIGGRETNLDDVLATWAQVAPLCSGGEVTMNDAVFQVVGDLAYEVGFEVGQAMIAGQEVMFDHRATNIYRRVGGTWKIVHHHTDLSAAMLDILNSLQS